MLIDCGIIIVIIVRSFTSSFLLTSSLASPNFVELVTVKSKFISWLSHGSGLVAIHDKSPSFFRMLIS